MRKQTNTLSPSPKGFQSPKFSDSDFSEVCGLGRPKSSGFESFESFKSFESFQCFKCFECFYLQKSYESYIFSFMSMRQIA
jgi:hypothetical protein